MVDCVYYEEMDIDKEAIKQRFIARFGEEYDVNNGTGAEKYIIKADKICNPTPEIYCVVLCGLVHKNITASNNCPDHFYKRYYNALYLLSMIHEAVPASKLEEWEGRPEIIKLRQCIN